MRDPEFRGIIDAHIKVIASWKPILDLDIPFERWEKTGPEEDPAARLLIPIVICGLPLHMEAYVMTEKDGEQCSVAYPEAFECLMMFSEGRYQTTTINDREYAIVAVPYGD